MRISGGKIPKMDKTFMEMTVERKGEGRKRINNEHFG